MSVADFDSGRPFIKMHGLGNDFVLLDARREPLALDDSAARALADRRSGIGCDQLVILHPSDCAHVRMEIRNADGGEVSACGNAARCVGQLLMDETGREHVLIETRAGLLPAVRTGLGIGVDMGEPGLHWRDIPLAEAADTVRLGIEKGWLREPGAVSMGNPHMVFFIDETTPFDLARQGPELEHHPLFPERANVSVALVENDRTIRLSVWERGVGLTRACGTAACAALVAAHRRGLAGREANVVLPGGTLGVRWAEDGHVHLAGTTAIAFVGRVRLD